LKIILHTIAAFFLAAQLLPAQVYKQGIVGYVPQPFYVGNNLIVNPLDEPTNNVLSGIFWGNAIPDGTTVSLWDSASSSYGTPSVYNAGAWSMDLAWQAGVGACINTPTAFTNTFTGVVRNHDGSEYYGTVMLPPPVFAGPAGVYLLGDAAPVVNTGTDVFLNLLGRLPNVGEQVTLLNAATQTYTTSTYLGANTWDSLPTLQVAQAGFFNINAVPEPNSVVLGLMGLALIRLTGRRR